MLKQRVITALVLLALLVSALMSASPWPFALFSLLLICAAAWEWARLNGGSGAIVLAVVLAVCCASSLALDWGRSAPIDLWWFALLVWGCLGTWGLRAGVAAWPHHPQVLRWLLGLLILWLAWLAIVNAHRVGINFMLSVFCLVWMADIAAYVGGRAFGKHKLAPTISPGKTWEGVWSGMVGVLVLCGVWLLIDRSFAMDSESLYTRLLNRLGVTGLVFGALFLSMLSVVGDLFESLVKRSAGAKDSSGLLPGHGGVLDRFDALLPVVPVALAFVSS